MRNRTNVDFIRTEVTLGERDGEIVVSTVAKIQLYKSKYGKFAWKTFKKRFPFITKNGCFVVTGRAVCGDEPFDFDKGKQIAETRAQAKAYNIANRVYDMLYAEFQKEAGWAKFLAMNCEKCEAHAYGHIQELD